jgi:hypothetical protein
MGMDCYAYAAWGLKTTRSAVKKANVVTKTWIGGDGPRTDFDPTTGKPNYKTVETVPSELDDRVLSVGDYDGDEVVIPLSQVTTGSHRRGASAVTAAPEPAPEALADFRASMQKLGLWEGGRWGHWVFLYISI